MTPYTYEIPRQTAKALEIKKGKRIKISQVFGPQMAVLIAYNREDIIESFSPGNTRISLAFGPYRRSENSVIPYWIEQGDVLVSTCWNRMMTVVEDTLGAHDIIFDPCDRFLNCDVLGLPEGSPGCRDLHSESMKPYNITGESIPGGANLFQNTVYSESGIQVQPTDTKPDDFITIEADMDLIVSISACPCPLGEPRDLRVEIL